MDALSTDPHAPLTRFDRTPFLSPGVMADEEILAVLLEGVPRARRWGMRAPDRIATARRTLRAAGSLRRLAAWSLPEIAALPGVGTRRAAMVVAAIELGRRTALERLAPGASFVGGARDVFRHYRATLRDERRELFLVALLDAKLRLVRDARISEGSLDTALVHPREAFAPAVREPAHAVVFVHNHPSGDPEPSTHDAALTHRLVAAGDVLGIHVLDHVVVGENRWYSFADEGRLRA